MLNQYFNSDELTFLAEQNASVMIEPYFSSDEPINTLDGKSYGPFFPKRKIEVPVWLGFYLSSKKSCRIEPPVWLNLSKINQWIKKEKESSSELKTPPTPYFMEIAFLFFKNAPEVVDKVDLVRSAFEDLLTKRKEKIRSFTSRHVVGEMNDSSFHFKNMTCMEVLLFRHSLSGLTELKFNIDNSYRNIRKKTEEEEDDIQ